MDMDLIGIELENLITPHQGYYHYTMIVNDRLWAPNLDWRVELIGSVCLTPKWKGHH